jgi:hypothetical protein
LSVALPLNCILTYQIHPNSVSKKKNLTATANN